MTSLYLFDDAMARSLEPFALTRPVAEVRAGALLIRQRWERALGVRAAGLVVALHLEEFDEPGAPPVVTGELPAGSLVANSRCIVALERLDARARAWMCDGRLAALRLDRPVEASTIADGDGLEALLPHQVTGVETRGRWLDGGWTLVADLSSLLRDDISELGLRLPRLRSEHGLILGEHPVFVEEGAHIEPQVCFDTSAGPVLIRTGAHVHAFSRIAGPSYIGEGSTVAAARLATCAIGERCKVGGEVSNTIFLGHANKAHDGFLGHSYLGRWVNLGAGTITSNLKNTYGTVTIRDARGEHATGMQFLGTLFGDHAKTGIGLRLTTGTLIGAGANLFGDMMPPKYVAPFSWGDGEPYQRYTLDKFLEVAERMMARRDVPLTPRARRQLAAAHANGTSRAVAGAAAQ